MPMPELSALIAMSYTIIYSLILEGSNAILYLWA